MCHPVAEGWLASMGWLASRSPLECRWCYVCGEMSLITIPPSGKGSNTGLRVLKSCLIMALFSQFFIIFLSRYGSWDKKKNLRSLRNCINSQFSGPPGPWSPSPSGLVVSWFQRYTLLRIMQISQQTWLLNMQTETGRLYKVCPC